MHDVDFLPSKYRDLSARRNIKLSRFVVVGAIALAIVGAATMQSHVKRRLVAEIDSLTSLHMTAETYTNDLASTNSRLDTERGTAELITYMRHPWPRTRLIATVVEPMPDSLSLDQISISDQKIEAKKAATLTSSNRRKTRDRRQEAAALAALSPAERDLKHLREKFDTSETVIMVVGRTKDRAALYYYLARLAESDLIVKAELKSLESAPDPRTGGRRGVRVGGDVAATSKSTAKFVARLVVARGHGQGSPPEDDQPQDA
ncbi:MAG: hypothetical protein MI757_22210 [Pirellulales bacterium]|nr:hypothetical protein [Pirellulales bacterium]